MLPGSGSAPNQRSALILTYHSVSEGPPPLCIAPDLLREHLDCVLDAGATILDLADLAAALRDGEVPERAVAFTFDDGYADIATAAPMLLEREISATVYCVAGYLGGTSDWPTLPARAPRLPLAPPNQLAELAAAGFAIGSHGFEHAPLHLLAAAELRREIVDSRAELEHRVGVPVRSFACPYGAQPPPPARDQLRREYDSACLGGLRPARAGADPLALPRIDAHYLRRPALLRRAVEGSLGPYLALRRSGARARRLLHEDYRHPARLTDGD
jgi:peptidoglycan/xylan/chitin deacetylase (PgdA/CDA1 family)